MMKVLTTVLVCCVLAAALALPAAAQAPAAAGKATVQKAPFGKSKEGTPVEVYTLKNQHGMIAKIATYGATLTELWVPDKAGKATNVVLGFDAVEKYYSADVPFFGATIGRYGNRIGKGTFTLNGKAYKLATNNGANHLHGGNKGFDKWCGRLNQWRQRTARR